MVLVACEESQAVTIELRNLGIEAYSCDILPCSGGHPEWHLQQDVTPILQDSWEMIIAFPPCTHLATSGAKYFKQKQLDGRQQGGINFFYLFTNLACNKVAIENPVGIMSRLYRKPDQIINPYGFGHPEKKRTCLWLKGLPPLIPTDFVYSKMKTLPDRETQRVLIYSPSKDRSKLRSKTYPGIAKAMAIQWGKTL